ncbi:sporulation stage V protein AC [Gracilibacillus halophilus YIM-C55.5]|uniref:Sporulation stage V protein AC n=1 Tax=Gracilibacillus halophilus YIM-C55.5 TaxID=1308866 RepID=N4WD55_9BACI|nr:sporulation stage V protein AC [Gracilibacillus halophilus YIM-C55.5]
MSQQSSNYKDYEQSVEPKRPLLKNCIKAFIIGGLICVFGQAISTTYMYFFNFTEETVGNPTTATLIFITMLLTGFGIYDRIAQFAGAGTAVPVTGFGNAVISAAIEHRTEGFVQGVGGNMFKLAGSVILFGVFSAFVIALIKTLFSYWSGM